MLKDHGLYTEIEKDYINYALHFSLWNYNTLAEPTKTKLREKLLGEWYDELGIYARPEEYFYNEYEYGQYKDMLNFTVEKQ